MDRVNLFNPFERPSDQHEDRLTWAFLVALKYDPYLQDFLRKLVESRFSPEEHRDYSNILEPAHVWEPAHISTQTKWIAPSPTFLFLCFLPISLFQR